MRSAVIVGAVRSAVGRGRPGGALSSVHPVDLYAQVLNALLDRTGVPARDIDDVISGCVSQVKEQASNVSRSATLAAGFPAEVPATTVDRQCGSSQQAIHFGAQGVMAGAYDVVIAGGVESMSRVPLGTAAGGADPRGPAYRQRFPEGLVGQGVSAELIAAKWAIGRAEIDDYSARSHERAAAAAAAAWFANEIEPVTVLADGSTVVHTIDETIRPGTTAEKLGQLSSPFRDEALSQRFPQIQWHVTAGSSSPLTDGAAAVLIMTEEKAREYGLRPRARFHSFAVVGDDPLYMLTGPIPATHAVLKRAGLKLDDIDVFEVNEAFAPVPLAWAKELGADQDKLNPWGGAIALGHPLGATGAKLMTTMLSYLEHTDGRYGLQTMCEGGGMANATIIERIDA